jgi:Icc protein
VLVAQLSDTHLLADPSARVWDHNPAENLSAVIDALPDQLDVLVITGDITEDGTRDAYRLVCRLTEGCAPRRFFIPGNHDDPAAMTAVLGLTEDVRMVPLSAQWTMGLVNTQWVGHDAGYLPEATLARLDDQLAHTTTHVVLCLHHPPISPCPNADCGMDSGSLLDMLRESPVRVVLSGHVHQHFDTTRDGLQFLGAPSTFRQLRHGGDLHYTDTGEPPAGQLVELHDNGDVTYQLVAAV